MAGHAVGLSTGLAEVDAVFARRGEQRAGLERGAVHEWLGIAEQEHHDPAGPVAPEPALHGPSQAGLARWEDPPHGHALTRVRGSASGEREEPRRLPIGHAGSPARAERARAFAKGRLVHWSPPLTILVNIAAGTLRDAEGGARHLVWVGSRVWPYAPALVHLAHGRAALRDSIFVEANSAAERMWAADLALRSRAAAAVIADGSGFDISCTRRLQLAAESAGAPCLLARPAWEISMLSAAATRWLVSWGPPWRGGRQATTWGSVSETSSRRWTVELLRCKGVQPDMHAPRAWIVERDHATRAVGVVADVLDRPGHTPPEAAEPGGVGIARTA